MDGIRFDDLTRRLDVSSDRRASIGLLLGSALGFMGLAESETRARKSKKTTLCFNGQTLSIKKSKKGSYLSQGATKGACAGSPPGSPPPAPSPPPSAACTDGIKNGDETDVDCGGSCEKCDLVKQCRQWDDCLTGRCSDGLCQRCFDSEECAGQCSCQPGGICANLNDLILIVATTCERCPDRTAVCDLLMIGAAPYASCAPHCGETFF